MGDWKNIMKFLIEKSLAWACAAAWALTIVFIATPASSQETTMAGKISWGCLQKAGPEKVLEMALEGKSHQEIAAVVEPDARFACQSFPGGMLVTPVAFVKQVGPVQFMWAFKVVGGRAGAPFIYANVGPSLHKQFSGV
jgi:hypothetical protein